jgi:hypothetical protein
MIQEVPLKNALEGLYLFKLKICARAGKSGKHTNSNFVKFRTLNLGLDMARHPEQRIKESRPNPPGTFKMVLMIRV